MACVLANIVIARLNIPAVDRELLNPMVTTGREVAVPYSVCAVPCDIEKTPEYRMKSLNGPLNEVQVMVSREDSWKQQRRKSKSICLLLLCHESSR
jgi:hypothetical protein